MLLIEIVRDRLLADRTGAFCNRKRSSDEIHMRPQEEREKHKTLKTRSGVDIKMKGIPAWLC